MRNENIWSPKQGETTVCQRRCIVREQGPQKVHSQRTPPTHHHQPTPGRRCLKRKTKVSLSLHIHAGVTVPSVQRRLVSTALLLSIPILRDLK